MRQEVAKRITGDFQKILSEFKKRDELGNEVCLHDKRGTLRCLDPKDRECFCCPRFGKVTLV